MAALWPQNEKKPAARHSSAVQQAHTIIFISTPRRARGDWTSLCTSQNRYSTKSSSHLAVGRARSRAFR